MNGPNFGDRINIDTCEQAFKLKHYVYVGASQIRTWTKESLREKPFSTVKGKIWTETPSSFHFDRMFTRLQWVKKKRETYGIETEELDDITQILSEEKLGTNGTKRILVEGKGFATITPVNSLCSSLFLTELNQPQNT